MGYGAEAQAGVFLAGRRGVRKVKFQALQPVGDRLWVIMDHPQSRLIKISQYYTLLPSAKLHRNT